MALSVQRVDVAGLLEAAATSVRGAAESGGIALDAPPPEAPLSVTADSDRAQIVLTNLLANAIRHTPPGGRVEVRAAPAGERVRFEVRDTGEGIPPEHLERVFDKFYRVPGARSGGVGLGLYISREIVHAHGGEMGVESLPGTGSTFWFTFPVAAERGSAIGATA
jgi:signal transduction histidine kinase